MVVQLCDPKSTAAAPGSHRAALLRRSGPGCAREAGPSGLAAMSSGRAGLHDKCSGAGGQFGPEDQVKLGPDRRLFRGFLRNDGNWQLLLAFLPIDLKHVLYIFL